MKHKRNDKRCQECCCGGSIHKDCGGILHEKVVDDDPDEGWIHNYRCDKCDEKYYHYGYEDYEVEFE